MKLKQVAVAVLMAASSVGALAEDFVQNLLLVPAPNGNLTGQFQLTHQFVGSFTDTINLGTFQTPVAVNASLVTNAFLPVFDIDFITATLNGVPFTFTKSTFGGMFEGQERGALPDLIFAANTPLILTIVGFAGEAYAGAAGTLAAPYTGTVNVVQVPEPGTAMMWLSGLALVGWVVRRRRAQHNA